MNKETIIKISDLAKIDIKDDQIDDILTSLEKILNFRQKKTPNGDFQLINLFTKLRYFTNWVALIKLAK